MVAKNRRYEGIGILGHYGTRNLGDEAIIAAVIQGIRKRLPQARIYGYSMDPSDTSRRHGIEAFPVRDIRQGSDGARIGRRPPSEGGGQVLSEKSRSRLAAFKRCLKALPFAPPLLQLLKRIRHAGGGMVREMPFLMKSYRSLAGVDLLLVAGSGQLEDEWGGAWAFPYTIFKWTLLARLAGARVVFISVGAGPILERTSKILIRMSLSLSDYCSFRDQASRRWIESISSRRECLVTPDLAHGLAIEGLSAERMVDMPVVGINPMPVYDKRYWHAANAEKYQDYVTKLASFARILARKGYPLFFFSTQPKDELVIEDIQSRMDEAGGEGDGKNILVKANRSVEELIASLRSADIVIATRFHGILLSQLAGTPALAICKDSKQHELMKSMGQAAYALPFDSFDEKDLLHKFYRLRENREREVVRLHGKQEEFRHALDRQYERVLSAFPEADGAA